MDNVTATSRGPHVTESRDYHMMRIELKPEKKPLLLGVDDTVHLTIERCFRRFHRLLSFLSQLFYVSCVLRNRRAS